MKTIQNPISTATQTILFSDDYGDLYHAIHELHELLAAHTGISASDIEDKDIYLNSGKAISPTKAAHCLLEIERTRRFIRGIYKAILHLKTVFPGERINILYAGTGPYSTLLLPLTTIYSSQEVCFHLLDINPIALEAVRKLYTDLNLMDYVGSIIEADASVYKIPEGIVMHLVVSETMQNALKTEPQVHIMLNLMTQLPPKGVFIPEEISVDAVLTNNSETHNMLKKWKIADRKVLGNIYKIGDLYKDPENKSLIEIPLASEKYTQLMLFTDIRVFKDETLTAYNCSLNMPLKICNTEGLRGKRIHFEYILNSKPYFKHTIIEP